MKMKRTMELSRRVSAILGKEQIPSCLFGLTKSFFICLIALTLSHVEWGGKWQMPTYDDFSELLGNCYGKWSILYYDYETGRFYDPDAFSDVRFYSKGDPAHPIKRECPYVCGVVYTSKINGGSIFLPAAGTRFGSSLYNTEDVGCYWLGNHSFYFEDVPYLKEMFQISDGDIDFWSATRSNGYSIRPVW